MSTTTRHETTIEAHPDLPTLTITRDFDASVERVWRAHVEPDLVAQWMGPRSIDMEIQTWDARTGGAYRYTALRGGEEVAHFYGSFHRVEERRRIVQTFGFEEEPEAAALETMTFTDLGDGRTRLTGVSVVGTMEERDAMLSSGMEVGVNEGFEKLDELLASDA